MSVLFSVFILFSFILFYVSLRFPYLFTYFSLHVLLYSIPERGKVSA